MQDFFTYPLVLWRYPKRLERIRTSVYSQGKTMSEESMCLLLYSFFLVRHLIIPHDPLGETSKGPPNGICRARSPHPAKASFTVPCPSCETLVPSQFNVFSWVAETLPLTGRGSISGRFMLISQQWKSGGLLYSHSVGDK